MSAPSSRRETTPTCEAVARCTTAAASSSRLRWRHATQNEAFLDLMEAYFEQSDGVEDARPDLHYQVGVTPSGAGEARPQHVRSFPITDKKKINLGRECPPLPDAKWRFFWSIGERPYTSKFRGAQRAGRDTARFPFVGANNECLGLFVSRNGNHRSGDGRARLRAGAGRVLFENEWAPHLLAPTGSDLKLLTEDEPPLKRKAHEVRLGTVLAGLPHGFEFFERARLCGNQPGVASMAWRTTRRCSTNAP